jgi:DNA-binding LacI/PurR family transcriptional regulator
MAKLKDIAKKTQLSVSTVSRILNNKGNFSEETRQAVLDAVKNDLILPDSIALQKKNSIAFSIHIFIPNKNDFLGDDPSSSIDVISLKTELERLGQSVRITARGDENDAAAEDLILQGKIDGAIVFDPLASDTLIAKLVERGIPFLQTNGHASNRDWSYIDYDNRGGGALALSHLYDLGHRSIGLIAGPEGHLVSVNRLEGCREAAAGRGIDIPASSVDYGAFTAEHGYEAALRLFRLEDRPSAIFAFSDIIAFGAMRACADSGIRIPEDVSLVGFDNWKISEFMQPALTTIERFKFDINHLIARNIVELMTSDSIQKIQISLKTNLVSRESCSAYGTSR